jgi:integrase/recombinase XerD
LIVGIILLSWLALFTKQEASVTKEIIIRAQQRAWLEHSVLQGYVPAYSDHLHRGRYAPTTRHAYLCCVAHFAHWLTGECHSLAAVNKAAVERFVVEHLPRCDCPYPGSRVPPAVRAALAQLLGVLRAEGANTSVSTPNTHLARELARFDAHMRDAAGLALNTRQQRCRIMAKFLTRMFQTEPILIQMIKPTAIRQFVLGGGAEWSSGTINVIGGAIGSYLRFRAMAGDCVTELLAAIPRAANWRLASLPEVLSDLEIDELLRSFDRPFRSHRRAFAMVRCLTDLGLRCSEVVKLRLEDINWNEGTLRVAGTKTSRVDTLPLPVATGSAIAAYLRDERPRTSNRAIFVRHVAPYDTAIRSGSVQRAVLAAYKRCGWKRSRVHIIRHSVASRLLRAGTPMKEIADVLPHRSLDTSAIYTKVDLSRLASVALPWPGSAS